MTQSLAYITKVNLIETKVYFRFHNSVNAIKLFSSSLMNVLVSATHIFIVDIILKFFNVVP